MKKLYMIDKILLVNPAIRGLIEWACMVLVGITGLVYSWPRIPLIPYINLFGAILLVLGLLLHMHCEKTHKQAHASSDQINTIVTTGVYTRLRHPIYLSLIMMHIGLGFIFGLAITVILSVLFSLFWIPTALTEEKFLLQQFPESYHHYMQDVKWRIIPNVF